MEEKETNETSQISTLELFIKTLCYYLAAIYILGFIVSALGPGSKMGYTLVQIIAAIVVITRLKPFSISVAKLVIIAQIYVVGYLLYFWNYDLSWDGNAYHGSIIHRLLAGWNMFSETTSPDRIKAFVENYVKNTEIISAIFGAPFGLMDFGRIAKVLFVELFGVSALLFAKKFLKFADVPSLIFALAAVFNPVLIGQIFTGYIDDVFYLAIASMVFLWLASMEPLALIMFAYSVGIKYSALFLSTSILIGLLFANKFILKKSGFLRVTKSLIIAIVILCASASFYIYNLATKHNPLYPTGEMNVVAFIHAPDSIKKFSNLTKFFISNLSFPNSILHVKPEGNESAFDMLLAGLERYSDFPSYFLSINLFQTFPDCRINGFGIFWPLLLLVSSVILLATLMQVITKKGEIASDQTSQAVLFMAALIYLTILVFPANWWARLVAHLWLVPLFVGGFLGKSVFKSSRKIALVIFTVMILNSAPSAYFVGEINHTKNKILENSIETAEKIAKEKGRSIVYEWVYRYELEFATERIKFELKNLNLEFKRVEKAQDFIDACKDKQPFHLPLFVVPPPPMWCI